jgi:hypothetical protein
MHETCNTAPWCGPCTEHVAHLRSVRLPEIDRWIGEVFLRVAAEMAEAD